VAKDETKITQDDVWNQHLRDVHVGRHWAYLGAVLVGGFLVMLALIALLGSSGG
jgi:hypothetical protein